MLPSNVYSSLYFKCIDFQGTQICYKSPLRAEGVARTADAGRPHGMGFEWNFSIKHESCSPGRVSV